MRKVIFIFNTKGTVSAIWKTVDYWMCQQAHSQEFFRAGEVSTNLNLRWKYPLIKGIFSQKLMILK